MMHWSEYLERFHLNDQLLFDQNIKPIPNVR